jgi:hypothetical protein
MRCTNTKTLLVLDSDGAHVLTVREKFFQEAENGGLADLPEKRQKNPLTETPEF